MKHSGEKSFSTQDIPSLTGIRALAAWWVVSLHYWDSFLVLVPALDGLTWLIGQGNYGVDLFFLLSGLIMMHVYGERKSFGWRGYRQFVWKRFARIYPGYLVSLLAMIALVVVAGMMGIPKSEEMYPAWGLPFEFLMVQAWGPLLPSWNYPAWSVSAEWFAYLFVFPIALILFRRVAVSGTSQATFRCGRAWTAVILAGTFLVALAWSPRSGVLPHAAVRVSCEFLAGAMLYRVLRVLIHRPHGANVVFCLGLSLLVLQCLEVPGLGAKVGALAILVALSAILLSLGVPGSWGSRLLGRQPWVYLGEISYALYLTHAPVQRVLKVLIPAEQFADESWLLRLSVFLGYLLLLLAAAALLYHAVERPARLFLTGRVKQRGEPVADRQPSGA